MSRVVRAAELARLAGAIADLTEARLLVGDVVAMRGAYRDSLYGPLPENPINGVFPIDTDALLRNRTAYLALDRMNWAKFVMRLTRDNIRSTARELRELIDAELEGR